jgi:hypothetical protein
MKKVILVKVFDIYTCDLEEFDLDSFKEFMLNSFKVGLAYSLCLILKFKDRSNEVIVYKLDFELRPDTIECSNKYIEGVYLWLRAKIHNLNFGRRSSIECIELRYTMLAVE